MLGLIRCTSPAELPPSGERTLVILLQPLGPVDPSAVDSVAGAIAREHDAQVRVARARPLPEEAFTAVRSPRYRADTLIAWLRVIKPDGVDLIVGLTAEDISITKHGADGSIKDPEWKYRDFGIFGLGYIGGPSCVVSTHRLGDGGRSLDRLKKIAVHEVGHNRSLPHCADTTCVMRDAVERIANIDAAGSSFCARCAKRLARAMEDRR